MDIGLRLLTADDVEAHNAGEDDLTVRWLTGGYGDVPGTTAHFETLAANAAAGRGKRGYGVWVDGRLGGYVDLDPDNRDGLVEGDVNISYAVHPWARGRGVAVEAVRLVVDVIRARSIGERVAIRVEPENVASVRVAEKAGFTYVRDFESSTDTHEGVPVTFALYLLDASGHAEGA